MWKLVNSSQQHFANLYKSLNYILWLIFIVSIVVQSILVCQVLQVVRV